MATEPNTTIKVYKGVPFDLEYKDTLYFATATAQTTYFNSLTSFTFDSQSYQRINKNTLRVEKSAEDLMEYNYLSITNKNHGNRTYYGFITDVSYINENTCEIKYEIDVLQSYLFHYVSNVSDIKVKSSFIEREHSYTDIVGENIEPEPVDLGEIVFNTPLKEIKIPETGSSSYSLLDLCVIIAVCDVGTSSAQSVVGSVYDGVYSGAVLRAFGMDTTEEIAEINTFLSGYKEKPDAVVGMYMIPKFCIGNTIPTNHILNYGATGNFTNFALADLTYSSTSTLDGHTVVNKKLYTYPYHFLHLENGNGGDLNLRYEFFGADNSEFRPWIGIKSTVSQPVSLKLFPMNYKGIPKNDSGNVPQYDYSEFLELSNYPQCSWNTDYYASWYSQNIIPMILQGVSTLGKGAITSSVTARPGAAQGMNAIGAVSSIMSDFYAASIHADIMKGNNNNCGGGVAMQTQTFMGARASITSQKAKVIDDFFTMFGYATNKVKVPNLFNNTYTRPNFYYVKTVGANIKGYANAAILKQISDIFDKGITFWLSASNYGNYSVNNAPA